jgi:hypothetical protein
MKRFTRKYRLQADSLPEITGEFDEIATRMARSVTFDGGKLRNGHLLNALVLWFNELKPKERESIAMTAISRLEKAMEEDGEAVEPEAPREPITGQAYDPKTGEPTSGRRRDKRTG